MVSDVPFGVFLSGGVDSSLNVALMAELMERPVETFSIGIEGDPSNEFFYARKVAKHFGANHHETLIDENDFISFLPKMAFILDEPLADPVSVPLYYVSKLARDSGTIVIQVGEGSDEVFAGYGMYHLFDKWNRKAFRYLLKTPKIFRYFLFALARTGAPPYVVDALKRAWKDEMLFVGNAIAFWDTEKEELLLDADSRIDSARFIAELGASLGIQDSLSEIIQIELKNRLPELLLMRVDKMSMANSIETRVPFLDEDLVEFALTIPSPLKGKEGNPKYILKKAAEGIIPDEIIYRRKWGFCGSATNMVTDKLARYARGVIMENSLIKELFRRDRLLKIFEEHLTQKRFNSFKIWNLLNLALWHDCWFN
jgi:asparagine synthase (glutamine-hydrolysing)